MQNKIRVAFIYKKNCEYLTGKFFANAYYHFFMNALKRNKNIEVTFVPVQEDSDISKLKGHQDIILLADNTTNGLPMTLNGIKKIELPVISRMNDPHFPDRQTIIKNHEKYKIDYYFGYMHEKSFYQYYPKHFKFKTIIYGLESSLYQNLKPYSTRIKNKILNSGVVGNTKFFSRIINTIRNPKSNALYHYKLRTMCNKLPFVDYTPTLEHKYVNDDYPLLLSKYVTAIAATTYFPTIKYWEIPAAGCLTFMEITEKNKGEYLGFIDQKSAIFIDENNYEERFQEYLSDMNNPKWEQIANEGKNHALTNLNNDKAVGSLVELMEKLI